MKRSVEAGKIHRIKIGAAIQRACDRMEVQGTDGWREERVQKKSVIQLLLLFLLNIRTEDRETRERKGRY